MVKQAFPILVFCAFVNICFSQIPKNIYVFDENAAPREKFVDFIDIEANLFFKPDSGIIQGQVTHLFSTIRSSVDSIFLDAPNIEIKKVDFDKLDTFKIKDDGIWIIFSEALPQSTYQLKIEYKAQPKKGMYFIGWNDPKNLMQKQIWTQGQGIDNRHWIPCFDDMADKVTTHFTLNFKEGYEVISNGELKSKKTKNGITTWKYNMEKPHSPYLMMIAVGKYKIEERKSKSGVPVQLYYYPEQQYRVAQTYRYSTEMIDFMEDYLNYEYPWVNYKQVPVADFLYGAMENTTATIFGDFYMVDEKAALDKEYLDVNAHELAHQWFGDLVTSRSGPHHWLHESFATFFQMRFTREIKGNDYYQWWMRENGEAAIKQTDEDFMGVGHSMAGSSRHYLKGAYVLDMLSYVMGEENFKKGLNHYLKQFQYGNAETDDLLYAFHEATGQDLYWFFEQWIKRGGEPKFEVSYYELPKNDINYAVFDVKQVHEINDVVGYFKMPIKFEVHYKDYSKDTAVIWVDGPYQKVEIKLKPNKEVDYVLFDPKSKILKSVEFIKPKEMLFAQAEKSKFMLDRYDAVKQLESISIDEKIPLFNKMVHKDEFQAVKGEIGKQIVNSNNPKSISLLRILLADSDPKVAKTILANTAFIPDELLDDYEALLQAKSYELVELELITLYRTKRQNIAKYLDATKNMVGVKAKNIRITWLKIAFIETQNIDFMQELVEYVGPSYEFLTRVKAAEACKELNFCNTELAKNLMDAVNNANRRLKNPCGKVLKYFYAQIPYQDLLLREYFLNDWTDEEKSTIEKYLH